MVVHAFHPSTQEAEAGGSLCILGHTVLNTEFQGIPGYVERPCLKSPLQKPLYAITFPYLIPFDFFLTLEINQDFFQPKIQFPENRILFF